MNKKLPLIFLVIAVVIVAAFYASRNYNKDASSLSDIQNQQVNSAENELGANEDVSAASNQWANNPANTISGSSSAPTAPVFHTIQVFNFKVNPRENAVPYVNVEAGGQVIMKWKFRPGEDIEKATVTPWLYKYGQEPITSGITQGLPTEIIGLTSHEDYAYEFTLTIPEEFQDATYSFSVFMSGCSSNSCGITPEVSFIVGNGGPTPQSGNNVVIAE